MGAIKFQEGKVGEVAQRPGQEFEQMDVEAKAVVYTVSSVRSYLEA